MHFESGKLLRISTVFFFVFYLISSVLMVSLSTWIFQDSLRILAIITTGNGFYHQTAIIAICCGIISTICACVAIYAVVFGNKSLLKIFIVFTVFLIIQETSVMVLGFLFHNYLHLYLREGTKSTLELEYGTMDGVEVTEAWDFIQLQYKCCGFVNGSDYDVSIYGQSHTRGKSWPLSCCRQNFNGFVDYTACVSSYGGSYATKGCSGDLTKLFANFGPLLGISATANLLLHLIVTSLAAICVTSDDFKP